MASKRKGTYTAAGLAAMLAIGGPLVASWEGVVLKPTPDPIGIVSVCYGETNVVMRNYSAAECRQILQRTLVTVGPQVAELAPGISTHPYEWAAHTSFAYNVGLGTYAKSSVLRLFRAGAPAQGCEAMKRYKYAGGKVLLGLQYRREGHGTRMGEAQVCLIDAGEK